LGKFCSAKAKQGTLFYRLATLPPELMPMLLTAGSGLLAALPAALSTALGTGLLAALPAASLAALGAGLLAALSAALGSGLPAALLTAFGAGLLAALLAALGAGLLAALLTALGAGLLAALLTALGAGLPAELSGLFSTPLPVLPPLLVAGSSAVLSGLRLSVMFSRFVTLPPAGHVKHAWQFGTLDICPLSSPGLADNVSVMLLQWHCNCAGRLWKSLAHTLLKLDLGQQRTLQAACNDVQLGLT
jgi:hypothetical protein